MLHSSGERIHDGGLDADTVDLALLFMSDFHIGNTSIHKLKSKKPFWVKYLLDGQIRDQTFLSTFSWRAILLFAIEDRKHLAVLDMDEPKRLRQLFPPDIMRKLAENAKAGGDPRPVLKLYHPESGAVVIITRSRCRGHAVDALHNLSGIGPVFQPVWISALMRLNAMIGLRLVRDAAFAPTMPISGYIKAAAKTGKIVNETELPTFPVAGTADKLPAPEPIALVQEIFDAQCRKNPILKQIRGRTIYDDYVPGTSD